MDDNTTKIPLVNAPDKFALVDGDYDGELLSGYRWRLMPQGNIQTVYRLDKTGRRLNSYLSRMAYGESLIPPGYRVINKNGDKLDCRTKNLIALPPQQHILEYRRQGARPARKKHSYRGVVKGPGAIRLYVNIKNNYLRDDTGHIMGFATEEEAALAYDKAALAIWGERAALNFPDRLTKEAPVTELHYSPQDQAGNTYGKLEKPKGLTAAQRQELEMLLEALAAQIANAFGGSLADLEPEDLAEIQRTREAIEAFTLRSR